MVDAVSIALSGLQAQSRRIEGSASNVANLRSTGALNPAAGDRTAYQPVQTVQEAQVGAQGAGTGTRAFFRPSNPAVTAEYQPDDSSANADGLVATPNVNLEREVVDQSIGLRAFQANIKALQATDELTRELLNLRA